MDYFMPKLLLASGIALVLGACSMPYKVDPAKIALAQSIQPTCRSEQECKLMWATAKIWVQENAAYKIKLITDDHMETYSPTGGSSLIGAMISKVPNKDGSYRLRANIWCDNMFGCNPDSADALLDLLRTVNAAK